MGESDVRLKEIHVAQFTDESVIVDFFHRARAETRDLFRPFLLSNKHKTIRINLCTFAPILNIKKMAGTKTFTMIKPDATAAGNTGKIIDRIIQAGFGIVEMKWTTLSEAQAKEFYAVHAERPFYGELVEYMTSGPIVAAILEKDNAVEDYRTLIGATNPKEAAPGTIRAEFAESIAANAVHGSDSDENAKIEGDFFFA